VGSAKLGDQRAASIIEENDEDTTLVYVKKFLSGNIILYRKTTVFLHMAEALNRMGYSDLAFAMLKTGFRTEIADSSYTYISDKSKALLNSYFFNEDNKANWEPTTLSSTTNNLFGVHARGTGMNAVSHDSSGYRFDLIVPEKRADIESTYGVSSSDSAQATMIAVEELLFDEYRYEFAFEGTRYFDMMRLARHRNSDGVYGSNFGSMWLSNRLAYKGISKDLYNENNWYLPFK